MLLARRQFLRGTREIGDVSQSLGSARAALSKQSGNATSTAIRRTKKTLARLHFLVDCRRRLGLLLSAPGCGKSFVLELLAGELARRSPGGQAEPAGNRAERVFVGTGSRLGAESRCRHQ